MSTRQVILKRGKVQAALEDGALVIEAPGMAGELVRSRLPANLDWLQEYLIIVEDAGHALANKLAAPAQRK